MSNFIIHKNELSETWSMSDFHSHNYYELYFLTGGSRDLLINNEIYALKENTVIFIPPFVPHKTEGGPFMRTNIYFPIEFITPTEREFIDVLVSHGPIKLTAEKDSEIFTLIDIIEKYYNLNTDDSNEIIRSSLCSIILLLTEKIPNRNYYTKNKQLPQDMVKALSYIKSDYKSDISASVIAKKLFLQTDYFCKKFKKHFKCSFSDYVLNLRISEAKKNLLLTNAKMEDIAESVGFSSANYFSLIFKKKVGQSPQSYRKNNQVLDYNLSSKKSKRT